MGYSSRHDEWKDEGDLEPIKEVKEESECSCVCDMCALMCDARARVCNNPLYR